MTIPARLYPYVECKIRKLYNQTPGVKSRTHVVFDVVDIAFFVNQVFVVLLIVGADECKD